MQFGEIQYIYIYIYTHICVSMCLFVCLFMCVWASVVKDECYDQVSVCITVMCHIILRGREMKTLFHWLQFAICPPEASDCTALLSDDVYTAAPAGLVLVTRPDTFFFLQPEVCAPGIFWILKKAFSEYKTVRNTNRSNNNNTCMSNIYSINKNYTGKHSLGMYFSSYI